MLPSTFSSLNPVVREVDVLATGQALFTLAAQRAACSPTTNILIAILLILIDSLIVVLGEGCFVFSLFRRILLPGYNETVIGGSSR